MLTVALLFVSISCSFTENQDTGIKDGHEHVIVVKTTTVLQVKGVEHLIELEPGETAALNCFSDRGHRTMFADHRCTLSLCPIISDRFPCCILITYEELPKRVTCTIEYGKSPNISVIVIPKAPSEHDVISVTNKTRYHCIKSSPGPQILVAGHMLSMGWTSHDPDEKDKNETDPDLMFREFGTIEEQPVWRWQKGKVFPCNNSRYTMEYEYGCLEMLPSSFPAIIAIENCNLLHNCGIVVAIICLYVLCYTIFCLCVRSCKKICKRHEADYWDVELDLKSSATTIDNERYLVGSDIQQNS